MNPDFPTAVTVIAIVSLVVAVACAIWTTVDVVRHPPKMRVMAFVWPLTMLFGSVLWLAFYLRWGRATRSQEHPGWVSVATGTSHCGAGCTLGDLVGEMLIVLVPAVAVVGGYQWLFADEVYARWVIDFAFAFVFGIAFQYFSIAPMRNLGVREGLVAALKADTLSITSWQVGMFGAMATAQLWILPATVGAAAPVLSPEFWWLMQIAMLVGFTTSAPVNRLLIRHGLKEAM